MEWISVKDSLPNVDVGAVLVCFLEPRFGSFIKEVDVGYYDDPKHYIRDDGSHGWRFWENDRKIVGPGVTHWMPLPAPPIDKT